MMQFNSEISDKYEKELLSYFDKNLNEKTKNLLHLMLLTFLFKPKATRRTQMKKPTVCGMSKNFICHVDVSIINKYSYLILILNIFRTKTDINKKKSKKVLNKGTFQPVMYAVGKTITSVTNIFHSTLPSVGVPNGVTAIPVYRQY